MIRPSPLLLALLAVLFFSGCGGGSTSAPVNMAVIAAIIQYFIQEKSLDRAVEVDQHKLFFIFKRAVRLASLFGEWQTEPDYPSLKRRVNAEYEAVEAYLGTKTDLLAGNDDQSSFNHLPINNIAKARNRDGTSLVRRRRRWYREGRRKRILAITWRAAGIEELLWTPSNDDLSGPTATFMIPEMNMVLDRRLRAVERMQFNVATTAGRVQAGSRRNRHFTGALGARRWRRPLQAESWNDGFRVRMFEYARVPNTTRFRTAIGASNIGPTERWKEGQGRRRLEYSASEYGGYPSVRFPDSQRGHWQQMGLRSYRFSIHLAGSTAEQIIDDMFRTNVDDSTYRDREDWWFRNWLFCDHVVAAINIEALLFGLRRTFGNATRFNDLVSSSPGYVSISAFVSGGTSGSDRNLLMADDDDPYFNNKAVPVTDLQIGDQLIFWNSQLYSMISTGDWRLENAFVMDVRSDGVNGGISLDSLVLQGHGTGLKRYPAFRRTIASKLNRALNLLRAEIIREFNSDNSIVDIRWHNTSVIKWAPFGRTNWRIRLRRRSYSNAGPWWIVIPVANYGGTVASAIAQIHKAYRVESDFVPPINPADGTPYDPNQFVFFPVYEPRISIPQSQREQYRILGTWQKYIEERRANPSLSNRTLVKVEVDGIIMPGIQRSGRPDQPVPVVQPKVTAVPRP